MQSQVDRLAELKRDLAKQIGDVRADVVELFNDRLERIKLAGMSPLEYMLGVMRDPDAPAYVAPIIVPIVSTGITEFAQSIV